MKHLFLLGNPRSGTSLLRLMLNQHDSVSAPPECGFAHWWLDKYEEWDSSRANIRMINQFLNDLFQSKKIETWRLDRTQLLTNILTSKPASYSELIDCVYVSYKRGMSKSCSVIVDKNNYYINHLLDLLRIWPDSNFLYMVRDGRDVACSYLELDHLQTRSPYKPKLPSSIELIAQEWTINNQQIIAFLSQLKQSRYLMVRYEDLVVCPEATLANICTFMGVQFIPEMLEYHGRENELFKEPVEMLDWKRRTLEKPDPTRIGRYKLELSDAQIALFNKLAYSMLQKIGYV